MPDNLKIIRIFIGSPGGLDEERQAAHQIVASVNRAHSERWGILFKLLGWENAVPGYVRPQSKINEDLDKCDYFIGVLWDRWGSRPSVDPSGFTSGFEEEFVRAENRINGGLMKDMALFFKDVEVPRGMEPGEDLRKVQAFRQKCIDEKRVFFKPFADVAAFRDVVREKLEEIGWNETAILLQVDEQSDQSRKTMPAVVKADEETVVEGRLLSEGSQVFLRDLMNRSSSWQATDAHEVARLRLLGTTISRPSNDTVYLGNHDANLIYQFYRDRDLPQKEIEALADCGVAGFHHQNVPLWRWMSKDASGDPWSRVNFLAIAGIDIVKKNAIDLLALGSRSIPYDDAVFTKRELLNLWISDTTAGQVFTAASAYLAKCASPNDIPLIEEIALQCSPERRMKIDEIIVAICARTDPDKALRQLVARQIDKVDDELASVLFTNHSALRTSSLISCLSAKSENIRLNAARILFDRREVPPTAAQTLMTDSSHEVRLIAVETLLAANGGVDAKVAEGALLIVKPRSRVSGLGSFLVSSETDRTYFDRFLTNRLLEHSQLELTAIVERVGFFDRLELMALYTKFPKVFRDEMRSNLADCFKSRFERKLADHIKTAGTDDASTERLRKLEKFIRTELSNHALELLCTMNKAEDIDLVRKVLSEIEIRASDSILTYLGKFGAWSDVQAIRSLQDYQGGTQTILGIGSQAYIAKKASAILAISKNRLADLLALDMESSLRIEIAKQLAKKVIAGFTDDALLSELRRSDDRYRVVFALRCADALSKSKLSALLAKYFDDGEHRFYNSIHWLDMAVSLPAAEARNIVDAALAKH